MKPHVLHDVVGECLGTGELVEIYRDRLTRDALVGRLLQQSIHVVIAERIDEVHGPNGLVAIRTADITRLKRGGRQLAGARLSQKPPATLDNVALLELTSAMTMLQKRFGYVTVYVEGINDGICFVSEHGAIDDDFVVLRLFGSLKSLDRSELALRTSEITRVEAGGKYEAELMRRFGE